MDRFEAIESVDWIVIHSNWIDRVASDRFQLNQIASLRIELNRIASIRINLTDRTNKMIKIRKRFGWPLRRACKWIVQSAPRATTVPMGVFFMLFNCDSKAATLPTTLKQLRCHIGHILFHPSLGCDKDTLYRAPPDHLCVATAKTKTNPARTASMS